MASRALALAVMVGLAAGPAAGREARCGPVDWSRLEYSASKFLLSASTSIQVDEVAGAELATALRETEGGRHSRGPVVKLTLETDLPFGRSETSTVWIDRTSGAALQREKTVRGRSPYWKLRRYLSDGYVEWRAEPAGAGEDELPPASWSRRSSKRVELALPSPAGQELTDSYALLYLLSAAKLDAEGKGLELLISDDRQVIRLSFRAGPLVQRELDFEQVGAANVQRRSGRVALRQIDVSAEAVDDPGATDDVDTGFMGMRGALTIFVDPASGAPMEVSGRSKGIGRLTVGLDRMQLVAPADG